MIKQTEQDRKTQRPAVHSLICFQPKSKVRLYYRLVRSKA